MSSVYLTKEIKKIFLVVFRELFALDTDFPYNKDDILNSSIIISAKYAEPKTENLLPQIIVSSAGYGTEPTTFYGNFQSEIPGTRAGTITKRKYSNPIRFNLVIDVLSTVQAEAENVADKVFNILNHEHAELFKLLNVNIAGVSVSEAAARQQYPQYQFVSTVTVQGSIILTWETGFPPEKENIFNKIKVILKTTSEL